MATAKFVLKEPNSSELTLIYLLYRFNGKRLKYSTSEKIHPKYWNTEKQRVKETRKFPEYPEFNARLQHIESSVNTCYRKMLNDGITPTPRLLKTELDQVFNKRDTAREMDLMTFIDQFIKEVTPIRKPGTIRQYKKFLGILKQYSDKKRRKIDFEDITLDFYYDFLDFMHGDLGYVNNTAGNEIKNLKTFLNAATEQGYNKNLEFRSKRFKKIQDEVDHIYLSEGEIERLYSIDLSASPPLEKVRDLFIVGCWVGLRISDLKKLTPENFVTNTHGTFIHIRTTKTNRGVFIPLHPIVKSIYEKYDNNLPPAVSDQKMNKRLKDLGQLAKFTDTVILSHNKGSMRVEQRFEKWQLMCTHSCRRSFCTNMYLMNVPTFTIMQVSGHKTEKSFFRYIKVDGMQHAKIMQERIMESVQLKVVA